MKPWHLKVSYLSPDVSAGDSDAGSVEEWWTAPDQWRQDWTSNGKTTSVKRTPEGLFQSPDFLPASQAVQLLLQQIVHPIDAMDVESSIPQLQQHKFGPATLQCLMLSQPIKGVKAIPLGLYPTYCLEGDKLVLSQVGITLSAISQRMGNFQNHLVPTKVHVAQGQNFILEGSVDQLNGYAPDPDNDQTTTGLTKTSGTMARLSGSVMAGKKIGGPQPVYPASARQNRLSGTVVLQARIGVDGRIHMLQVMSSPDPDLSMASVVAVQQWTYTPYTLNGAPTNVMTTITVNFSLNH